MTNEIKRLLSLYEETGDKEYYRQACLLIDSHKFAEKAVRSVNVKTGYLEEKEGVKSSTRLVFVLGTLSSVLLIAYMIYTKAGNPIEVATAGTMLIAAFGGTKYLGTKNESINKE